MVYRYLTKNVVLATGSYDKPNSLDVPGEDLPFVVHSLKDMEAKINSAEFNKSRDPILIVGAGLSAADAIIGALNKGLSVIHAFRRDPEDRRVIFNNLPPGLYPEYHEIHKMMASQEDTPGYRPYAKHHVSKIEANGEVTLHGMSHLEKVKASLLVVLIGASPNLEFLDEEGLDMGVVQGEPISRNNPIDIDLFSHESVKHSGIYAIGPLVGDNFVRFLQGGALAITNNILKKKLKEQEAESSSSGSATSSTTDR